MKIVIPIALLLALAASSLAMIGSPVFTLGQGATCMSVVAARANLQVEEPAGSLDAATSERLLLSARYGLLAGVDVSASLGAATLGFGDLPAGFSKYTAPWSFAWGARVRAGFPWNPGRVQLVLSSDYLGFTPRGKTANAYRTINSKYLWHEITPAAVVALRLGPFAPYLGADKTLLLGQRDDVISLRGQQLAALSGRSTYSDYEQPVRGILGLEWRLPDGYSIGAEAAAAREGTWTLQVSISQTLK